MNTERPPYNCSLKYIKYSKDKNTFMENVGEDDDFRNVSKETADVINAVTGYDVKIVPDERGKVNMCDAIKGIKEDARNDGWNAGWNDGNLKGMETGVYNTLITLVNQGKLSLSDAAETAHLTVPEFIEKTGLKV